MKPKNKYPTWICNECGENHGNRPAGISTWHPDFCGMCGEFKSVTEPRDFGHLKDGWLAAVEDDNPTGCPDCRNHTVVAQPRGGVACTTPDCGYWFCF